MIRMNEKNLKDIKEIFAKNKMDFKPKEIYKYTEDGVTLKLIWRNEDGFLE